MKTLEKLVQDHAFEVIGVVTQPDRPAGRQGTLQAPPMKIAAQNLGLNVYQFEHVKNQGTIETLKELGGELAIVASFGQIMPQALLDIYLYGVINIHPSLLPAYRGPTPFLDPILNGDKETGISIIKMDAWMDHGPLLKQVIEPIRPDDTGASLGTRLWEQAANILPDVLKDYLKGNIILQEQDHTLATKTRLLTREDAKIDWTQPATTIERKIRAYIPWPGTYTAEHGTRLKIHQVDLGPETSFPPGKTFIHAGLPAVACGNGSSLILKKLQPDGKKQIDGSDFLRGARTWEQTQFDIK